MFDITFLKTLNIVYLESNIHTGSRFRTILEKLFNKVYYFQTAQEGISFLKEEKNINIIICDISLKDKSGLEVLEKLRNDHSELPFILTTLESSSSELLEAIKLHIDDFLIKPINPKDLVTSIEEICHKKYQEDLEKQTVKNLDDMISIVNEIALVSKTNLNQEITFVNDSFSSITGFTKKELIGNKHDIIRDINSNKNLFDEIYKNINIGKSWEGKIKNFNKNNEEFYVHLSVIPILDEGKNIKEFIWIRFLITEYELEKKEFKKNAAKNIHQNRRVNNDAREKIDNLMKKLAYYENLDNSIHLEKQRNAKFLNQIKFYENEITTGEEKLKSISDIANKKIKEVIESEKITREHKNKVDQELKIVSKEFLDCNKKIQDLTKELDEYKKTIKEIEQKIINIEQNKN